MLTVGADALPEGVDEIAFRPATDAGLFIRRDVWRIERAERCLHRAPASQRDRIVRIFSVTTDAATCVGQVLAALDQVFLTIY